MKFEKKKILVTVKAYPNPSRKYSETVCCAGVDLSNSQLVRLYPIPFRDLDEGQQFKKYSIIEVDCSAPSDDKRPESFHVNVDTIKIIDQLDTDKGTWERRKSIVLKVPAKSMCQVYKDAEPSSDLSLGLIKPTDISFECAKQSLSDQQAREVCYAQLSFLDKKKNAIEEIPFNFYYKFKCSGEADCPGHKLSIIDWEIGQAYRDWRSKYPTDKVLLEKIKQRWLDIADTVKKDVYFYVGNMKRFRNTFMVLSVFYPPKTMPEVKNLLKFAKENAEKKEIEASEEKQKQEDIFGNILTVTGDRISQEDMLGRKDLVEALANIFIHTKDEEVEGLTVALLGDWGEGKSTVMGLLEKQLRKTEIKKFECAKFNAWEYEHTDNIAAGLAQEVVNGLMQGVVGFWNCLWLHVKFAWCEYRWNFIYSILCLLIIGFSPLAIYLLARIWSNLEILLQAFLGVGALAILVPLILCIYRGLKQIIEHPLATQLQTYLKLPTYGDHLGLVPVLKRHIKTLCSFCLGKEKKLIVFIDDLDRCHAECISKTMDAIRLVMTIPNVIILLGIDHRIAFKAVKNYYKKLGDSGENHTKPNLGDGSENHTTADIARDYLGKIIQLPIRLMPANSEDLEQFVNDKLFPNAIYVKPAPIPEPSVSELAEEDSPRVKHPPENTVLAPTKPLLGEELKEMQETTEERDKFYELANKFKFSNPRQLLRLRNSYRLLKVLNSQHRYHKIPLMTMLFWQEFLHNYSIKIRNECMAMLLDKNRINKIASSKIEAIANDVYNDIKEIFDNNNYREMAEFARVVVLPHSEEGVLDTSEEIKKWIGEHKNS